jgi:5'-nucleotidase
MPRIPKDAALKPKKPNPRAPKAPPGALRILISNDDGIDAPGIYELVQQAKRIGDVIVVAPLGQQSAVGHAITMNQPLRVKEFQKDGKFFGYAVEGTPADCVKLALRSLLDYTPDLILSGINHGSNTAVNIMYSGTVSAATEGTIMGIPSVALSLTTYGEPDFRFAAKFSAKLAKLVMQKGLPRGVLLNVNIPAVPEREIKGVRVTRQGKTQWNDTFEVRRDPINRQFYWLTGSLDVVDTSDDTDHVSVEKNYISITPIQYDLTDYPMIKKMKAWGVEKLI